jgi:precorrin-3B synthase
MASGDGLIVRLRISCGEVPLALARDIADWAEAYGNGALDLSSRANLQIRGVSEATLPTLTQSLAEAGLIDASPEAEAVRNVLVSPFAGLVPPCDVRPYARAWEQELARERDLWALPTKFGAAFDAGAYPLGVETDLVFTATAPDAFVLRLGGLAEIGPFPGAELIGFAKAAARAFLALRETETPPKRMREAIALHGLAPFSGAPPLSPQAGRGNRQAAPRDWLGAHGLGVGIALPFGRIEARDLRALAGLAAEAGAAELRLTPWRALLIPCPAPAAPKLAEGARKLGLILDARDPLLGVAACPGAPACSSALGDTRDAARRLAPLMAPGVFLHVSGCEKGCAHPGPAAHTVVAAQDGYKLIRNGRADAVARARGLTLAQIALSLKGTA